MRLCREERAVLLPGEQICFMRTVSNLPDIFTPDEWKQLKGQHHIHELGYMSNLSPNYADACGGPAGEAENGGCLGAAGH